MSHTSVFPARPRSPRADAIVEDIKGWIEEARADLPEEPVEVEIWRILKSMRTEIERSNRKISKLLNKGHAHVPREASTPIQLSLREVQ